MSDNKIKCPNCGTLIDVEEVIKHQAEEKYKKEFEEKLRISNAEIQKDKETIALREKEFEEKKKNENELFFKRIEAEKERIKKEEAEKAKVNASEEFQLQLKSQQDEIEKRKRENSELKEKEMAFLKREEELKEKEKELELQVLRKVKAESEVFELKIKQEKDSEIELLRKEFKIKEEQQAKLIDEMKRKSGQGSTQLQGEILELALEDYLKDFFPLDTINEIGKGARGADILQIVNTKTKDNCGKIYIESKNAETDFKSAWIEKFKADMREKGADIGVLVTKILPKEMKQMGMKEGIWICTFSEFKGLIIALRETVIKVNDVYGSQQNKGEKMSMLYDYLIGTEFKSHIEAIVEGFSQMKEDLESEKRRMQIIWKMRETQIEKVLISTMHMYGSIKGIGGKDILSIKQLDMPEEPLLGE